ncbi:hypothetical protein [Streptomyces sp. NPDC097619]|uniref:hypothetical protein n=1 Tax=Streptomyces sp. NPDC097619 TaxID=3157228 RepID=UPI00331967F1
MRRDERWERSRRLRTVLGAAAAVCAVTAALPGPASAEPAPGGAGLREGSVARLSVAADGAQATGGASHHASITPDGRHVIFLSSAAGLTADAVSAGDKPYLRDGTTGEVRRPSHYAVAEPAAAQTVSVSGDGRYTAYPIPWVRHVRTNLTRMSSGASIQADCYGYGCNQASWDATGRYLALVVLNPPARPGPPGSQRIEVQDPNAGTARTVASLGHLLPSLPSMSGDGRLVAYQDAETQDVYVRDMPGNTRTGPVEGPAVTASLVQLSDDGTKVVYRSGPDTHVHDLASGTTQTVPGVKGLAIDPTGRYLLYAPNATGGPSLLLRDLVEGTDEVVAQQPATAGVDAVSSGGREVVFESAADDLVPGDTNGVTDVFIRRFS